MNTADIVKIASNVAVATAFLVAAALHAIPWLVALGATALLLTPSSLPELVTLLRSKAPPNGVSVLNPSDDDDKGDSP